MQQQNTLSRLGCIGWLNWMSSFWRFVITIKPYSWTNGKLNDIFDAEFSSLLCSGFWGLVTKLCCFLFLTDKSVSKENMVLNVHRNLIRDGFESVNDYLSSVPPTFPSKYASHGSRNGSSCLKCGISKVLECWPFWCQLLMHRCMVVFKRMRWVDTFCDVLLIYFYREDAWNVPVLYFSFTW